ncbi:GntR family transcriptional regulator [Leucobacter sp. UCMA 4100]|uniref:GntR family transcriptional regulator n=1 Tax=Leucobacter sp. UCMA 4100 TaxID=2810534 RepID=UPI0022EAD527|nr:GntR family transcriptional regulator [Leucobacter sp. UCMA 4100]MDA3146624.1 GntR family transcriptional regulator [Leucobacter sp. UCMA 4100]
MVTPTAATASHPISPDVTADLRTAILNGEFAPQQRLVEVDLCEQFGASRATVRTALLNLSTEGLVERLPNRGARVRAISVEEAIEILEVRLLLESLCARKLAEIITPEQSLRLTSLRANIVEALDTNNLVEYSALHQQLDAFIREHCGQETAAQLLLWLQAQAARHQFRLSFRPGRAQTSGPEHLAIIDAITSQDPDAAEAAIRIHLESVIAALKETQPSLS